MKTYADNKLHALNSNLQRSSKSQTPIRMLKPTRSWSFSFGSSLVLGAWFLVLSSAHAQFSIDYYKVAGGGGTSTGGVYAVSGTIGQPDAGPTMSGGNFSLTGGFWSLISVVPTPGAPLLSITRSNNTVTVSWPSPSTGFVLQQNTSANNAAGWSTFGGTINDNGTIKSITISPPTGKLFLRLNQ